MNYGLYAIKDTLVGFLQPFIQPNDATATREFANMVNKSQSAVSVNYQNMELYKLGSYDSDTGIVISDVQYLVKGADVKEVLPVE